MPAGGRFRDRIALIDSERLAEQERWAHFQRSLSMALLTFVLGAALFALFFGLVAACERL